jgi:hypothetical protein
MKIELITNIEFGGIDWSDYPDMCDVYIESADYDGIPMDADQLEEVNKDSQLLYELFASQNDI